MRYQLNLDPSKTLTLTAAAATAIVLPVSKLRWYRHRHRALLDFGSKAESRAIPYSLFVLAGC
jgi:hypothetical protein